MLKLFDFLLSLAVYLFGGYAFMITFNRFPAEIFDLPTINFAQALALGLVVSFFKRINVEASGEHDAEKSIVHSFTVAILYGVILLIGLILVPYV